MSGKAASNQLLIQLKIRNHHHCFMVPKVVRKNRPRHEARNILRMIQLPIARDIAIFS